MAVDSEIRHQALSCLLLGFVGETPPTWLLDALDLGLAGVVLFGSNLGDGTQVNRLTHRLTSAAGRPLVLATDEEGGDVTRLDTLRGSASPGAAALGFLDDVALTEETYAAIGVRLADAGVTMNLAPVADVNVDALNPVIGLRSFGADPPLAGRHVAAAVRGVQRTGVAACVKHFPGHGATRDDSHHGVAVLDRTREEIEGVELEPFRSAIAAGTRAVMTGHLLAPALDSEHLVTLSRDVTTGLLRERLGFEGVIVTDALEMKAVASTVGIVEGFVQSLIAGADAIEAGAVEHAYLVEEIPQAVEQALREGRLTASRLADAAARTASLARRVDPGVAIDRDVLAGAARRCLEVRGRLPELVCPLVLESRTPGGMASGELPWTLGGLVPGEAAVPVAGPDDPIPDLAGRSLVLVIRDPLRHPWQHRLLEIAAARAGSVVVDVGWPTELDMDVPLIRTRGIAPGLLAAAAELLTSSVRGAV